MCIRDRNLENAQSKTPVTAEIMKLFNELIGEYPFASEKYGHAQFGWIGGMEHQTMSFMKNFDFGLVSHELAHQWFGDYITLGSWQDIWLNEGFASYLAGLSHEHLLKDVWPNWKKTNVEQIISQPGGSVFVKDTTDIETIFSGRLSYSKGAYILHMLRWIVGDEDFFLGMQNYFNDPEVTNGFARTHQFISHMENAADTTLTEFFEDWFYGEGFPVYTSHFVTTETNSLKITLSQNTSHQSVDFFEMPVPVRVYNLNKTDSSDFRLIHTTNNQEFIVDPGFKVTELIIDPEYWLVSRTSAIVNAPIVSTFDEILVYPNPFTEKLKLFVPGNTHLIQARLYSTDGTLILQTKGNQTVYDWSFLPNGVYILQLTFPGKTIEKQIIKQ